MKGAGKAAATAPAAVRSLRRVMVSRVDIASLRGAFELSKLDDVIAVATGRL
jgi:hypothetical protein